MAQSGEQFDVIIAGSGIAGLSAATTAARAGLRTLVLTGQVLGGHLVTIEKIDGYPGHPEGVPGFDLCPASEEQAVEAGAEFLAEDATALAREADGWKVTSDSGEHTARAVIVASGTSLKALGLDGEDRLFGKGISHCASCDAPMLRGKEVAVAGGGDSALQEALTLAPVASRVTIIAAGDALTAQKAYRDAIAGHANVDIRLDSKVSELVGADGLDAIRISGPDGEETLDVASLFVFVGLAPNTGWLAGAVPLDANGFIEADGAMRTATAGLYAAGTVRAGAAFRAAASAGDGAMAALSVVADLAGA